MFFNLQSVNIQLPEVVQHRLGRCLVRVRHQAIGLVALLLLRPEVVAQVLQFAPELGVHLGDGGQVATQLLGQALFGNELSVKVVVINVRLVGEELYVDKRVEHNIILYTKVYIYRYHFKYFRSHKRSNHRDDAIEERHHIDHVDLAQFAGQRLLQVVEEFLDAGHSDPGQMAEAHLFHVEHENDALVRTQLVQANV